MHGGDNMELQHVGGNATSDQLHHLIDLWATARAMVFRIEGFALVAILFSFFVVIFGSCRRWSNRWIIQKGFLAASALSLSLGTYSIGLMQSSSVKSRMYPVWSVSLLALFVSVDSISTYSIDYSGQLLKMMYQLCLYFGYAFLIIISTAASGDAAVNTAIGVLCAITLFKGIHRLMAYVFPTRLRSMSQQVAYDMEKRGSGHLGEGAMFNCGYMVFTPENFPFSAVPRDIENDMDEVIGMERPAACSPLEKEPSITIGAVWESKNLEKLGADVHIYRDICLSFSLCHLLQRRFFGFHCEESGRTETRRFIFEKLLRHQLPSPAGPCQQKTETEDGYDHEGAFKVIEAELAFLYDYMYSSDAFVYYYESRVSMAWTLASILGICSLCRLVAGRAQLPPSDHQAAQLGKAAAGATIDTTTADLTITIALLVSLASLQVLQLVRCWSSNWARLHLACWLTMVPETETIGCRMRLKAAFLGKVKWLADKFQWQNKLGQLSLVDGSTSGTICTNLPCLALPIWLCSKCPFPVGNLCLMAYYYLLKMFGLRYIRQALRDTLGFGPGGSIALTSEVKKAIVETLIRTDGKLTNGRSSLDSNGVPQDFIRSAYAPWGPESGPSKTICSPFLACCQPWSSTKRYPDQAAAANQAAPILTWHIVTTHCDKAYRAKNKEVPIPPQEKERRRGGQDQEEKERRGARIKRYHRVATALSRYCAYLVAHAPELLPGQQSYTRAIYDDTVHRRGTNLFSRGKLLGDDELRQWKVLADFWAEMLLYLAPSDNVSAHMERLAQGGEFITHLWALLFHAGIVVSPPAPAPPPSADVVSPRAPPPPPPPSADVVSPPAPPPPGTTCSTSTTIGPNDQAIRGKDHHQPNDQAIEVKIE